MGKQKYIESPEALERIFVEYKSYVKTRPYKKAKYVGHPVRLVYEEKQVPLTMIGFECYCAKMDVTTNVKDYFRNKNGAYSEYAEVCRYITNVIREDMITGAMLWIYNASIVSRVLSLKNSTNKQLTSKIPIVFTNGNTN